MNVYDLAAVFWSAAVVAGLALPLIVLAGKSVSALGKKGWSDDLDDRRSAEHPSNPSLTSNPLPSGTGW